MIPGVEEVGKTTRSFFDALKDQPLSLALVAMNVLLVAFLWYSQGQVLSQRAATTDQIVKWQQDTDRLMASCVSKDVTQLVLDNMQKITETMLATAKADLDRMQRAVDQEREQNRKLVDEAMKRLQKYVPPAGIPFRLTPAEGGD